MDEKYLANVRRFSWGDIKKAVESKTPFEAISPMATALIRVKEYKPLLGLAIHAGHRVREEFVSKMAIEEQERQYEEDVGVEHFVANFPVQMIGLDSRYEYDVNRARERAVYLKPMESWGKKVWMNPPSKDELEISFQKYDEFHDLLDFLVEQFTATFKKAVIFDIHSYNQQRQTFAGKNHMLPLFNLGTTALDKKRHAAMIELAMAGLSKIKLPGVETLVKENDVFKGDGAVAKALAAKYPDSLFLNIEIKKAYMNETTGELHAERVRILADQMHGLALQLLERFQS